MNELVLNWISTYGSPLVAGIIMAGAAGLPFPTTLVVILSGAFIRTQFLDPFSTILLGFIGVIIGDMLSYTLGRLSHRTLQTYFGHKPTWQKAQDLFAEHGGYAIFLTRWLVTSAAIPVNLIAGSSNYSPKKFLLLDTAGELVWLFLFGTLGYVFASQWELLSQVISNVSYYLLAGAASLLAIYLWWDHAHRPLPNFQALIISSRTYAGVIGKRVSRTPTAR